MDLNPHQIEAALFALKSPLSKGVLLADEVGLGKTIEAGIVICQYWSERKRRLLVICPASLRKQWALELEEKFADIEKNLRMIQTLRSIALDLIIFLAQLEDFQKKLWLKKKFVVAAHYCITLDRVPESLYPEIAANPQQWEQWDKLGMLSADTDLFKQAKTGSIEYLKQYPYLMVDTALFDIGFKHSLLATVDNLDESLDGLLIHGDNFQALNLLQERYQGQIKGVFIDPPYNTEGDTFLYKDIYKHSSWISFMSNLLHLNKNLLPETGCLAIAIGEDEYCSLSTTANNVFGEENRIGTLVWQKRKGGGNDSFFLATDHDYIPIFANNKSAHKQKWRIPYEEAYLKRYKETDEIGRFYWDTLSRPGLNNPIIYDVECPDGSVIKDGRWQLSQTEFLRKKGIGEIRVVADKNNSWMVHHKIRQPDGKVLRSILQEETNNDAANEMHDFFSNKKAFSNPKPIGLVRKALSMLTFEYDYILDYFAGSGTTGHAAISLNRQDNGHRKYILVEQGDYFDTVLKPRIQKVVYSSDWKNGKPTTPQTGISHAFKVLKIESYEDTLNNLELRRTEAQKTLFDNLPKSAKEDYLLRYMLDIESRGSLLSVDHFRKPFDFRLKVTVDSAGAYEERTIDLVETFNYLIGLRVKHIDMQPDKGFGTVTGCLPTGEKTLVIWRDTKLVDYEKLDRLCTKLAINPADSEFEIVYINGDHNIPTVSTSLEAEGGITRTMKIRQIEPEFLSHMFAEDDVI